MLVWVVCASALGIAHSAGAIPNRPTGVIGGVLVGYVLGVAHLTLFLDATEVDRLVAQLQAFVVWGAAALLRPPDDMTDAECHRLEAAVRDAEVILQTFEPPGEVSWVGRLRWRTQRRKRLDAVRTIMARLEREGEW